MPQEQTAPRVRRIGKPRVQHSTDSPVVNLAVTLAFSVVPSMPEALHARLALRAS